LAEFHKLFESLEPELNYIENKSFVVVENEDSRNKLKKALQDSGLDSLQKEEIWSSLIDEILIDCEGKLSFFHFEIILKRGPDNIRRIENATSILPNFERFCEGIQEIFEECILVTDGKKANYIPQLAKTNENYWAIAFETVDGRIYSKGDVDIEFSLQSCSKPLIYCLALEELGMEKVQTFMSFEPSGARFNAFTLTDENKPFNPFVNSGAIVTCGLLMMDKDISERFQMIQEYVTKLAGGVKIGFNNSIFLSERGTADRNKAIAYWLNENKAFPPKTNLDLVLDLYFQTCSLEASVKQMATVAATLAKGGICPRTGRRILSNESVRDCLILLFSCGMYDYSGEWAFHVGLPAKSGVSGCIMVVIPNVLGFATFSPLLDAKGNSVKGVEFCKKLTKRFNFHLFTQLVGTDFDPNTKIRENSQKAWIHSVNNKFLQAASTGDLKELQKLITDVEFSCKDSQNRTALHLSAMDCVKWLINEGADINAADRVGYTPLDEAIRAGMENIVEYLSEKGAKSTIPNVKKEAKE